MFLHLRYVLIYIFLPNKGANFKRGFIIKELQHTHSDTIPYSDVFFITSLYATAISSDDEIDDYKRDGNISNENDLR